MPDLLKDSASWLAQQRGEHLTTSVVYERSDNTVIDVPATKGKTDYEVGDASYSGATLRAHVIDFLITANQLGFDPQAGDAIVADGQRYEVMDLAGQGAWRWSDPGRTTYRIHTKETGPSLE
jgi:hypothetical protein